MDGVPDGRLVPRQRHEIVLEHRLGVSELQVRVEPPVHRRAADVVVVVAEVHEREQPDAIGYAERGVELLQLGIAVLRHPLGPVVSCRHPERPRREERRDLDIAGAEAQIHGVLARAAALHARGHHHRRERHGRALVDRPDHHRLRAAAAGAGHGNPRRVHVVSARQPVERADAVPDLEPHDRLQVLLGLRAEEEPGRGRPRPLPAMGQLERQLHAVGVADHVVEEDDCPHARQLDGARLQRMPRARFEALRAGCQLLPYRVGRDVLESSARPVSVRREDRRQPAVAAGGTVQAPGHEVPGHALEEDALDRVALARDRTVHDGVQRPARGPRPETQRHANLAAQRTRALAPLLPCGRRLERKMGVQILQRRKAAVGGRRRAGRLSRTGTRRAGLQACFAAEGRVARLRPKGCVEPCPVPIRHHCAQREQRERRHGKGPHSSTPSASSRR